MSGYFTQVLLDVQSDLNNDSYLLIIITYYLLGTTIKTRIKLTYLYSYV